MKLHKLHRSAELDMYATCRTRPLALPFVESGIQAGFPSPANDHLDIAIDLNKELVKHPSATFMPAFVAIQCEGAGIEEGDLLVVDRSLEPVSGKIAVCCLNGEFTVKRLCIEPTSCTLLPANDRYEPIRVSSSDDFLVWGMVVHVIKSL